MKNNIKNLIIIIIMLYLLLQILMNKTLVFNTISYSLNIWVNNLLPSMFPFFIISDILISYHITNYIPKYIKKTFRKLFHTKDNIITIFFLSSISGFPSNAKVIKTMYHQNEITKEEATHALIFTHFSNPLFILSTVAVLFLHQEKYGYIILISHYLGNIILGIITRNQISLSNHNYIKKQEKSQNFSTILINSIKNSIDTLLLILGTLTTFLIASSLLINKINTTPYNETLIKGTLEITMGLKQLSTLSIPDIYKVTISTIFLSFGGLSVHLQVLSQITDTDISYHPFFIARIFHAIISGLISFIVFKIIY